MPSCFTHSLMVVGVAAALILAGTTAAPADGSARVEGPKGLTASIRLADRSVRSGGVVRGEVVFNNPTAEPQVLLHSCRTDGLYGIGFRAANGYMDPVAFALVGCDENLPSNELIAQPGITVFRFRARATYSSCSGGPESPKKYSPDWSPPCQRGSDGQRNVIPSLPAGDYSVVFVPDGGGRPYTGPRVQPARLTVTQPQ